MTKNQPGLIVLFGSGETSASSGKTYETVAQRSANPLAVAILETPAGFEPNSAQVAGKVGEFMARRLQNYNPQIDIIPARKKGTSFSPDDAAILQPMWSADWLFLGPGSPTYAVRQLQDSLAWQMLVARQRLGAALLLASAATVAMSATTLPVYEIYKVGQDLHWQPGLDFFGAFGLSLTIIPHWNNTDGGEELDTSRCFMGRARFEELRQLLPPEQTVLGLDEHTSLVIDPLAGECTVMGNGRVVILRGAKRQEFASGQTFAATELGPWQMPEPQSGIHPDVWQAALAAQEQLLSEPDREPETAVLDLVEARTQAREQRQWAKADELRAQIEALGWQVQDTPAGPQLSPLN
ncbi:MAG: cysteinyl-tRNA synthetase [Ardenticatenaceae bacterium]|nr:cysteinyl-tRNA synthetase [Ardenticatenaceae bacterium]